ncbi:hypothetical protein AB0C21_28815 [Spirillospora sp. NPDC049024]
MGPTHRLAAAAAAALLAAGGLAGCSLPGTGSSSSGGGGGGAEGSVGKASFDNPTKPVVQGTVDSPIAQGAKVDIAVMGLKVKGKLANLTVRFTPRVPGNPGRLDAYDLNGKNGLGTSLIDPVNLKRYVVVRDAGDKELQTHEIFTPMPNNQPTLFFFSFAAPPESVKAVDVQIGSWPTFRDIPVQR